MSVGRSWGGILPWCGAPVKLCAVCQVVFLERDCDIVIKVVDDGVHRVRCRQLAAVPCLYVHGLVVVLLQEAQGDLIGGGG